MTEMASTEDQARQHNGAVLVTAAALAVHFGCSPQNVAKLTAAGVITRSVGGYDQGQCRLRYIAHLRSARSARSEADAAHVKVKTEMLQLRLMEKRRELVRRDDVDEVIDGIAGVVLTALSSLPARCAPRGDLAIRRSIERVVFEVRTEIAKVCLRMADEQGEPEVIG